MSFVTDSVTKSTALLSGQVDAEGGILGQSETDMKAKGYQVLTTYDGVMTLVTDSKNPDSPFSKIGVRQALDYAIDRDVIVKPRGFRLSGSRPINLRLPALIPISMTCLPAPITRLRPNNCCQMPAMPVGSILLSTAALISRPGPQCRDI